MDAGGKKLLDLGTRNKAIEIRKLKSYLTFGANRPRWAYAADELIRKSIPKK